MIDRWILAPVLVLASLAAGGIAVGYVANLAGFWGIPGAAFGAAFFAVLAAYFFAPTHKLLSATIVLILGAIAAWQLLVPFNYIEVTADGASIFHPTHSPIIGTYIGGALGLLLAVYLRHRAGSNKSFNPTPLRGAG